ncbi:MAG: uracil-DNA glycosylase [Bacillota bacterium]|jgi:DNA polymerase
MESKEQQWRILQAECLNCTRCGLAPGRTNVVFGEGALDSRIMFVGEGPGQQEDLQGRPFVGRAGQLLDKMLASIGLSRETNAMICNIVKCRPPDNRTPTMAEGEACLPWLRGQVAIVRPRILVCLGATAVRHIIDPGAQITKVRGQWFQRKGYSIAATYHPAALLRTPSRKVEAWEDLQGIMKKYTESCDEC